MKISVPKAAMASLMMKSGCNGHKVPVNVPGKQGNMVLYRNRCEKRGTLRLEYESERKTTVTSQ